MANTNLYIGLNNGDDGFQPDQIAIGLGATTGKDIELRVNAVDVNGNTIRRIDAQRAVDAMERVLQSGDFYTTDLAE